MKNITQVLIYSAVFLIIGVFVGWLIFANAHKSIREGAHMMNTEEMVQRDATDMGNVMSGMMNSLYGKTGDTFDKAFIDSMVEHHEGAVAMAEAALKSAGHKEIKNMANAIISAQTNEIKQMKEWKAEWYK